MALLTHFLQVLIMTLIQFSKICEKAATVSDLGVQTHIHDYTERHQKPDLSWSIQHTTRHRASSNLSLQLLNQT